MALEPYDQQIRTSCSEEWRRWILDSSGTKFAITSVTWCQLVMVMLSVAAAAASYFLAWTLFTSPVWKGLRTLTGKALTRLGITITRNAPSGVGSVLVLLNRLYAGSSTKSKTSAYTDIHQNWEDNLSLRLANESDDLQCRRSGSCSLRSASREIPISSETPTSLLNHPSDWSTRCVDSSSSLYPRGKCARTSTQVPS